MLMLLSSMMIVSTVLFAIGVALERAGEANESSGTHAEIEGEHQEGSEIEAEHNEREEVAEEHEENTELAEAHKEETVVEEPHSETILGIDFENPVFVIGAIGAWLALTVGLWLFGRRVLVPIIIVAVSTAFFDILEVITQLNRSNSGLALLAAFITVLHLAVAALAGRALLSQPSTKTTTDFLRN